MYEKITYYSRMSQTLHVPVPAAAPAGYRGPGDIVAGAEFWYGLRAYDAAYAAPGNNPAIDVKRASDTTTTTINILSTGALDEASLAAWLTATTGTITKFYDQSGNNRHLDTSFDLFPTVVLNAQGSHSAVGLDSAGTTTIVGVAKSPALTQPISVSAVYKRTGDFTALGSWFSLGAASTLRLMGLNAADSGALFAGNFGGFTATDNAMHAVQGLYSGAASESYVDGTPTTVDAGTGGVAGGEVISLGRDGSGNTPTGNFFEGGFWAGDQSTHFSDLNTNQHDYWGF